MRDRLALWALVCAPVLACSSLSSDVARPAAAPSYNYGSAPAEESRAAPPAPTPLSEAPAQRSAPAGAAPLYEPPPPERPGLGTVFGEGRYSPVRDVPFARQGPDPFYVATLQYNDEAGIAALRSRQSRFASYTPGEPLFRAFRDGRALWGGVTIQVVDEDGQGLSAYHVGDRVLVVGQAGRRYALLIENRTGQRFEIVASVDGLDVIDGKPARLDKRGYLVAPHGRVLIEGYRRSMDQVAAFRFGTVRDAYASKSAPFGDRHVGVIGVALFAERGTGWEELEREAERREQADPFPGRFAQPPPMDNDD